MTVGNVHPDAPREVKEKVARRPCIRCGYPPKAEYVGPALTTECPLCGKQRPFYDTW